MVTINHLTLIETVKLYTKETKQILQTSINVIVDGKT